MATRDSASKPRKPRRISRANRGLGRLKEVPWVRYEPAMWLVAAIGIDPLAELAHRRLADVVWTSGEWPEASPETLARLTRLPAATVTELLPQLQQIGWEVCEARLCNLHVASIRRDAASRMQTLRALSRSGNRSRWHPVGSPVGSPAGSPAGIPCGLPVQYSTVHNTVSTVERSAVPGSARGRPVMGETEFLTDVEELFELWKPGSSPTELTNWGGWWRVSFRRSPKKAQAVLAEVRCMVREKQITKSPGQAAMDIWKRLP
jgi:hypothetical protein